MNVMEILGDPQQKMSLKELLVSSFKYFIQGMHLFDESSFVLAPEPKVWSAFEITDHILKSNLFIHNIVVGDFQSGERAMDRYVPVLKQMMEDEVVKGKAAAALQPDVHPASLVEMLNGLNENAGLLMTDVEKVNLADLCINFKLPGMAYSSRFELISFAAFHMDRHARQLRRVHDSLDKGFIKQ